MAWWNSSYLFRKEISLSLSDTTSAVNSLIEVDVNFLSLAANNTVISGKEGDATPIEDYSDVEVVHESADATPVQTVLGRAITDSDTKLYFESNVALPDTGKFYMYYGNATLANAPTRPSYTLDLYPLTTNYDGVGISYTRPNEHWIDGSSFTANSRATFEFSGSQIQINGVKGPDAGIALVSVDGADPDTVDLYQSTEATTSIYTKTDLSKTSSHVITVTVSAEQNLASLGSNVKITSFQYPGAAIASLGQEENDQTLWATSFGV